MFYSGVARSVLGDEDVGAGGLEIVAHGFAHHITASGDLLVEWQTTLAGIRRYDRREADESAQHPLLGGGPVEQVVEQ